MKSIAPTRLVYNTDYFHDVEDGKAYLRLIYQMSKFLKNEELRILMLLWILVQEVPCPEARKLQGSVRRQMGNKIKANPEYSTVHHQEVFNEFVSNFYKFEEFTNKFIAQGFESQK